MDDEKFKSIVSQKCRTCFKNDWCLCKKVRSCPELCLGPFKDKEDNAREYMEEVEKGKKKANLRGYVSNHYRDLYRANKDLFEHGSERSNENPDEDKE
jgi:hypothetical protein